MAVKEGNELKIGAERWHCSYGGVIANHCAGLNAAADVSFKRHLLVQV
jgi:hypothetical protein